MSTLAKFLLALDRAAAGLRRHSIPVDDHLIQYAEGGRGETVLLLHGFGADCASWNRMAKVLTKHHHVIAPDLPGWGASTRLEDASYSYPVQVERVHRFVQEMKLEHFHLAGHSMGGGIAARYAAKYPAEVTSLALIAAHGLIEPRDSELKRAVLHGENWLLVSSHQDFEHLMDHLFVKRPYMPRTVLKYMEQAAIRRCGKNRRIFDEIQQNDPPLISLLPEIKAPTLVIWGDTDLLVDVSAVEVFRANISGAQVLVLPQTGHMPLVDHARQCVETYLAFLNGPMKSSKNSVDLPSRPVQAAS